MRKQKLIFVYNADSSLEHKVFDFLHKAISPETYACSLCSITHGTFRMKQEWKAFIASLPFEVEFLYKNEFKRYHANFRSSFPAILLQTGADMEILVDAGQLKLLDLPALKEVIRNRLLAPLPSTRLHS